MPSTMVEIADRWLLQGDTLLEVEQQVKHLKQQQPPDHQLTVVYKVAAIVIAVKTT